MIPVRVQPGSSAGVIQRREVVVDHPLYEAECPACGYNIGQGGPVEVALVYVGTHPEETWTGGAVVVHAACAPLRTSSDEEALKAAGWLTPGEAERLKAATKQVINDLTADWSNLVEDLKAERAAVQPVIDAARVLCDAPFGQRAEPFSKLYVALAALDADSPPEGPTCDEIRFEPCGCLAYDPVENNHTEGEHTSCGGTLHGGVTPCGGCDSCVSAQVASYRRLEREEV